MKWRVMLELDGAEGALELREVSVAEGATGAYSPETFESIVAEGKKTLTGLQRYLVRDRPKPGGEQSGYAIAPWIPVSFAPPGRASTPQVLDGPGGERHQRDPPPGAGTALRPA